MVHATRLVKLGAVGLGNTKGPSKRLVKGARDVCSRTILPTALRIEQLIGDCYKGSRKKNDLEIWPAEIWRKFSFIHNNISTNW